MRVTLNIIKHSPDNVEKIELEDVASYEVTDSEIKVKFNGSPDESFPLMSSETQQNGEWFYLDISATRIGLKIDMTK